MDFPIIQDDRSKQRAIVRDEHAPNRTTARTVYQQIVESHRIDIFHARHPLSWCPSSPKPQTLPSSQLEPQP